MANFEPKWDIRAERNTIIEGQEMFVQVDMSNFRPELTLTEYTINDNQYIEFELTISSTGNTTKESDYIIEVGESKDTLENINDLSTGSSRMYGTHKIKIKGKSWKLASSTSTIGFYFIKLSRPINGVWDSESKLTITMSQPRLITILNNQEAGNNYIGVQGNTKATITYDNSSDIWVTPDLLVYGKQKYTIGAISYGADSRLFVQAFGKAKDNKVFVPAYEMVHTTDIPTDHITGSGTVLKPYNSSQEMTEETPVTIKATNGNDVLSGLSFMSNGQLVKTLLYQSEPVDAYFTAKIVSIKKFYSTDKDAYKLGKRFRAYQMFVAPMDVSYIKPQPKAGHLYILRDTKVYPYVVKESDEEGKLLFEENVWIDLGVYDESIASSIIGSTKRFRILVNSKTGSEIEFETDPNLGTIHVGEYFGHTVMPVIKAKGDDLITYKINKLTSPDDIEKYNLHLSPDGTLLGTAFANATDFGEKDEINLEFDVVAMARSGLSNTQRFKISIVRGMGANYLSAYIKPTLSLERKWFQCVSSENFNQARYFRASDPRYGLQSVPRMLLKENYYNSETAISSTRELKRTLRNNIISKLNVPTSMFQLVLGNYKVRSAMDNQGNVLYDLLYREVHPVGITIGVDKKYRSYTPNYNNLLIEIYGLRENIYRAIGEDTRNLLKDPDDLKNRAVQVKGIKGISTEMLDTVPRYMSHPYEDVLAEYVPIIPVAYLQAGTAEAFMVRLQQSGEHKAMVGEIFDVYGVEFDFFHLDNEQYVQDSFMITLPSQQLGE